MGAVIGIFLGGWLASAYSFKVEFVFDSICLLMALLLILLCHKTIEFSPGRSIAAQVSWGRAKILSCLWGSVLIAVPVSIVLFKNTTLNNILMILLLVCMVVILLKKAYQQPTAMARNKLIAFVLLALISVMFWTLYNLEPSFISIFVANNVDTQFLGLNIPASSFFAFDGVFVILIGLILSRLWFYLNVKQMSPSLSIKFALSLIIIGIGFAYLALMTHVNGNNQPLPARYIIIAYAIFSTGELFVGPLGISMVGSLGPEGYEGVMMGFWQLCLGIGGVVAGYIAMAPNLPDKPMPLAQTNPLYIKVFLMVGLSSACVGLIVLLFSGNLSRLMQTKPPIVPTL
jgi:POT family proton-dependent oligopeptide transporter